MRNRAKPIEEIDIDDLDSQAPTIRSIADERVVLFIPLRYGPDCFGFLTLAGGAKRFTPEHVTLLETCARYMAVAIYNVTLSQEKERLEALATRDALTGAYNRRAFDERLIDEWRRAVRSHEPLSLVMVDVDYFKVYNDSYGHVAGDHCLQQVVQALLSCVSRSGDMVARYGGEEFVGIAPQHARAGWHRRCRADVHKVDELRIVHRGSELDHVSISAGVATMFANNDDAPQTLDHDVRRGALSSQRKRTQSRCDEHLYRRDTSRAADASRAAATCRRSRRRSSDAKPSSR